MPPRKGMSRDDKLTTMQAIMMESQDVWTLKDLEKECPKRGVIQQAVKEILQELVDNDLVSFDKIGSSNFYWCFPSEAYNRRMVSQNRLDASISALEQEIAELEQEIGELEPGREDCDERKQLDEEIVALNTRLANVSAETAKYGALNPVAIRETERQAAAALDAANRWTDNIYTLRSWCVKKFNLPASTFDKQFGLDDSFDYFS